MPQREVERNRRDEHERDDQNGEHGFELTANCESTTEAQRAQRRGTREEAPLSGGDAERPGGEPCGRDPFQDSSHLVPAGEPSPVCPSSVPSVPLWWIR